MSNSLLLHTADMEYKLLYHVLNDKQWQNGIRSNYFETKTKHPFKVTSECGKITNASIFFKNYIKTLESILYNMCNFLGIPPIKH